jgi:hypothetical protein
LLDGKKANLEESDLARRNTIATLLSDWGLVNLVDATQAKEKAPLRQIKVVSYRDKSDWELCQKYNIGQTKK